MYQKSIYSIFSTSNRFSFLPIVSPFPLSIDYFASVYGVRPYKAGLVPRLEQTLAPIIEGGKTHMAPSSLVALPATPFSTVLCGFSLPKDPFLEIFVCSSCRGLWAIEPNSRARSRFEFSISNLLWSDLIRLMHQIHSNLKGVGLRRQNISFITNFREGYLALSSLRMCTTRKCNQQYNPTLNFHPMNGTRR